jgi:hypothetical protein
MSTSCSTTEPIHKSDNRGARPAGLPTESLAAHVGGWTARGGIAPDRAADFVSADAMLEALRRCRRLFAATVGPKAWPSMRPSLEASDCDWLAAQVTNEQGRLDHFVVIATKGVAAELRRVSIEDGLALARMWLHLRRPLEVDAGGNWLKLLCGQRG